MHARPASGSSQLGKNIVLCSHIDIQTRPDHGQMSALLYRLDDVMTGNELQ